METQTIKRLNTAVFVLKHFVELSASLLPFLEELTTKKKLSKAEITEQAKVIEVYSQYSVDPKTSLVLMDSDILDLISSSFNAIMNRKNENDVAVKYYLGRFKKEYNRLKLRWNNVELN